MPSPSVRSLRTHQRQLLGVARAIAAGASGVRDVLAAVTPGGGKSLLPVLMAQVLMQAGVVERVCWVVPRDSLRLQAEEAFADPAWRAALGHSVRVRAAENLPDPCRGLEGYVTTYQGVAAAPDLHLAEFRRHAYLLVVDEVHHLPALAELDPLLSPAAAGDEAASWSQALLPLLECARVGDHRLFAGAGAGRAGGIAGHVRGAGRGGALAGRTAARNRPAPAARRGADAADAAGAVHGIAHRLCRGAVAGSLSRHPPLARRAAGGARAGAGCRRPRARQIAGGGPRPGHRPPLSGAAAALAARRPGRRDGAAGGLRLRGCARDAGRLPPAARAVDPDHGGDGL